MRIKPLVLLINLLVLHSLPFTSSAQTIECDATSLQDFYDLYGGTNAFSAHTENAINTFIQAEEAINAGNYAQAETLINNLFAAYPKGSTIWWNVFNDPNGANLGTPHAYYGLRMMEDIVEYYLNPTQNVEAKTANMKVVLVGCSEGIQPTTELELQNGTGQFVTNTMNENLMANDYCIIKQSLQLFTTYVTAITKSRLNLNVEFIELPGVCMDVSVSSTTPYFATGSIQPVWEELSEDIQENTDWWWILYPSHVPSQATFDDEAFITGGMGLDAKGGPVFIIDDKWLTRKPPHLGTGEYNDIERRIYLPQWLQHEFYHHLYRLYPEFSLEVNGHDWFDLSFWPGDFEGRFEPDFYAESLHKRIQTACIPLERKLITRVMDDLTPQFETLSINDLIGPYSLDNIQNAWHIGEIIQQGSNYYWRNSANVQWQVTPNLSEGVLETGPDSPYPGQDFFIELYQNYNGNFIPGITGLRFQNELYRKRFNLLRESIPLETVLDLYETKCLDSLLDRGNIIKETGQFYWQNDSGELWSLIPDTDTEIFSLNNDSPTPGEEFELILIEDECDIHNLGFKYLDYYYWRPKRDSLNESPTLVNPLADLMLPENFGSHLIDLSDRFEDAEGEEILLFTTSMESTLVSSSINGQQLELSGGDLGNTSILVIAVDPNGGLVMDKFEVEVSETVSNNDLESKDPPILIYPNLTKDYLNIIGESSDYNISIYSANNQTVRQEFSEFGPEIQIYINDLSPGVYFIAVENKKRSSIKVEKFIKY